jgi:hypothetical protein
MSKGPLRNLRGIVDSDNIIRSDNYLNLTKNNEVIKYVKRDFLYRGGCWRGERIRSLLQSGSGRGIKVIIGHADKATNIKDQLFIKTLGYEYIYGINLRQIDKVSSSLPLGLTNRTKETDMHPIFADDELLIIAENLANINEEFDYKFYFNLNIKTNFKERNQITSIIDNNIQKFTIVEIPEYTKPGRIRYLTRLRDTTMIICPFGNGFDTHRFWETIYMGGIPVVRENVYLDNFFDNLPVIKIGAWNQILDSKLMEQLWFKAKNMIWNPKMVEQEYWNNLIIKDSIKKYI